MAMRIISGSVLLAMCLCSGCSQKVHRAFIGDQQISVRSASARDLPDQGVGRCNDQLNFAPDLKYPEYTVPIPIRVNVHFMDIGDGVHNLNTTRGREFALQMIERCNAKLKQNAKMHLPLNNDTPVLPVPWYLVLTPDPDIPGDDGIYFHYDTALYYYRLGRNTNQSSREVLNKYGLRTDSVFNVFMMPHPPDSVGRPGYRAVGTGIMLSNGLKIAQIFTPDLSPESCVGLLNHELAHALGLSHTWGGNDGCDDTPKNANCWYYTDTPPCDSLVSNNMMDYNAWQAALTPCQIGRVMRNVATLSSRVRKHVRPDWCTYDPEQTIIIRDSIHWQVPKDLAGDIIIADGGVLQLSCRLSMPPGGRIVVFPDGKLVLNECQVHNACGEQWEGIEILRRGRESGVVEVYGTPLIENVVHGLELTNN